MSVFNVSFDVVTVNSVEPKWIFESIGDQLEEDGEWLKDYDCVFVGENNNGFMFNISFVIGTNYYSEPDWIFETVWDQLEENEIIMNNRIEMQE